jgi:hypothetical protein
LFICVLLPVKQAASRAIPRAFTKTARPAKM